MGTNTDDRKARKIEGLNGHYGKLKVVMEPEIEEIKISGSFR